jgi:hypothetical protein
LKNVEIDGDPTPAALGARGVDITLRFKAGTLKHQDATLIDKARRPHAQKDSRQIFEVAALATKGVQAGTYYGSVRWGWRTDGAGKLTKIDLQKVSDGVPSSSLIKAAGLWDEGTSSTGAANVKLGAPEIFVTTAPVTLKPKVIVMLPLALRAPLLRGKPGSHARRPSALPGQRRRRLLSRQAHWSSDAVPRSVRGARCGDRAPAGGRGGVMGPGGRP